MRAMPKCSSLIRHVLMDRRTVLLAGAASVVQAALPLRSNAQPIPEPIVIDLTTAFFRIFALAADARAEAFRTTVYAPLRPLFTNLIGKESVTDREIGQMLQRSEPLVSAMRTVVQRAPEQFARSRSTFLQTFGDFDRGAKMVLAPSFFCVDGAARVINGMPAFVLGVDRIAERPQNATDVLYLHELFHVHHYHAAPDAIGETVWQRLWDEGLATYASMELANEESLSAALADPTLEREALPVRRSIADSLRTCFDDASPECTRRFFTGGPGAGAPFPPRSGYYLGTLAVREIAAGRRLPDLARMRGADVRRALLATLSSLAA